MLREIVVGGGGSSKREVCASDDRELVVLCADLGCGRLCVIELGLLRVDLESEVAVQIPVNAQTIRERAGYVIGTIEARSAIGNRAEEFVVEVETARAGNQFKRAIFERDPSPS